MDLLKTIVCVYVCVCERGREREREREGERGRVRERGPAVKCANRLVQPDVAVLHGHRFHLHPAALMPDGKSCSLLKEK